jgi:ketosteroid isomerase-like protein
MFRRRAVLIVPFVVAACAQQAAAPPVDFAAEEQAIRAQSMAWLEAAKANNPAGEAAVFADDGIAYRANSDPIMGPAAFEAYATADRASNPQMAVTWTTDRVVVAGSGDMGYELGTYHVTGIGPDGTGDDTGKYVTVWKKVNDTWKVAADISVTTKPETPTTTTSN